MSRVGFKSVVYHGDSCLGELETIPVKDQSFHFPNNEIRIHHISPLSERCPPLSILQTISSFSVRCKLESTSLVEQSHLINLHASCLDELKTAVVLLGEEEVHLVAMPSKQKKFPCFWCYSVPSGLYNSCIGMLNLRCLAIVFDLDETLIVANTMKSFNDRIGALKVEIARETVQTRILGMSSELKRYVDDRALLKQYIQNDCLVDNEKVYNAKLEEVAPLSESHKRVLRPVIRLPERNIVLTRINPEIRDTSVLVRLRPAWDDLRSYLTSKGRKRFEVYVCTRAEREYALEMWRLLDPEAHLIGSKQLLDRVVCIKSGTRKSLLRVFQNGNCHSKMAMVIDDRSKVWEDMDQSRVYVVPAFTPYCTPQAETADAVPVLRVARDVTCNVRVGFFKEFDEHLLRRISELFYEDDVVNLPTAPDVSNHLMLEDASFVPNGNTNAPIAEGMNGPEVAQRLHQLDEKYIADSAGHIMTINPQLSAEISQLPVPAVQNVFAPAFSRTVIPSEKLMNEVDPQLWFASAGSTAQVPLINSLVYYFPEGHAKNANAELPVIDPPHRKITCRVSSVLLRSDPVTDEAFAEIGLTPCPEPSGQQGHSNLRAAAVIHNQASFKALTRSDIKGSLYVSKQMATTMFPALQSPDETPSQIIYANDPQNKTWTFKQIRKARGNDILSEGWRGYVKNKNAVQGDALVFLKLKDDSLLVGIVKQISSIERSPSIREAVSKATTGIPFNVTYYPRVGPQFCLGMTDVDNAFELPWSDGVRFKMAFETENFGELKFYNGQVTSIRQEDPWNYLEVRWQHSDRTENPISPWTVEPIPDNKISNPRVPSTPPSPGNQQHSPIRKLDVSNVSMLEKQIAEGESSRSKGHQRNNQLEADGTADSGGSLP